MNGRVIRQVGAWIRLRRRRLALVSAILATLLVLPPALAAGALWWAGQGDPAGSARTRGADAAWLGHAWVDGRKGPADLAALPQLVRGGVRDLYVHAGPLEHDGSLPADRYPAARQLLDAVHRELPGVRVQAWLGDVVAPEHPDGMHLDDPAVRARVVASARQVLDAGFDGVHYDLEPLQSGSAGYLDLLDATRAVTSARHAELSVATPQIDPLPGLHAVAGALTGHPKWWSQEYFGQVARRVDQIAVMSYDTAMPVQSLYQGYVAQQTELALQVVPGSVDLLMGLPAYWDDTWGHRGSAETVPAAVRGVRAGLSAQAPGRQNFGVAVYADFSATDRDWESYRRDWCGLAD
ncbi:glycosyl hydrolase family 18 protein [Kitasatospora viridis]|uniref:Glycosyl hydrolase family 18 (Putative chitinase) n=1 Tax=Kitasatospora viridis TaxID=281105 RepID=A0A561UNH2_9ACTN|nr:glycosyl hydrolase family 18 protein [Kitasatospora viridis]TWG00916.1 glycosyl hydrolase family 18 (putative chitinase) [Kitasatospora viridis]